ncbi:hypothetical protein WJ92_17550 [Burkholderia ubonensis]|uniref:DUF2169 family type VI secretion system accessory protein n=1 Tax=Burkholderia ubonensis TaxID=101571 RepID=UPI000757F5A3|nr:pentapeptide repeat-containing protein [Burkholderia ubonensis]KVP81051.1 hypothetical protein WJ92_17550 [Burkholderia ubonensis]
MKIVKPDTLALLCRTLRLEGVDRLSIGALALFPLRVGAPPGPEDLATETELWRVAHRMLDAHAPLDEGFPKPAGEFLVYGEVHAPARDRYACASVAVRVRIGAACKERLSDVRTSAPLPDFRALSPSDRERTCHLGPFDARWRAERWPHLPAGTRAEYFHTAPRDQRIIGFWLGGEEIELVNMHTDLPIISGSLPNIRGRCFVERAVGDNVRVDACAMRAETVWLFPDAACGIVLYRALAAIDDEDGDDVLRVIAGWESADEPALPDDAYVGRTTADDTRAPVAGVIAAASTAIADDGDDAEQMTAELAEPLGELPAPDLSGLEQAAAALAEQTDALLASQGLTGADIARLLPAREARADLNLDELAVLASELDTQAEQWQTQYDATGNSLPTSPPSPPLLAESRDASLTELLRRADAQARVLVEQHGLSRMQVEAAALGLPKIGDALDAPLNVEALTVDLAALTSGEAAAPEVQPYREPLPATHRIADAAPVLSSATTLLDTPPPGPLTREQVMERHSCGLGFASLDLSDLDLSSAVLERADFRGARLERTCLDGCRLAGASFDGALLPHANFSNADLRDATLVEACATGASFRYASLDRARLDRADFTGGDFTHASLVESHCANAQFDASAMSGLTATRLNGAHASFARCALDSADFTTAQLPRANFQHAMLVNAMFASAQCEGVEWYGAQALHAQFRSASLRGSRADASTSFQYADLRSASLDDANWDGADLRYADLRKATLDNASLVRAIANGVQLLLASARRADLSKADFTYADVRFSNLFGASLRHARFDSAQLNFSNLYGADCYGTAFGQSQLDGANVERTLLAVPGRPEYVSSR